MADSDDPVVEGKAWALLSYLSLLCLLPLILKRNNEFALFHAKQGLLFFLFSIVFSLVTVVPVLGFIGMLGNLVIIILCVVGLFKVLQGKYWEAPVLGKIAKVLEF